MLKLNDSVSSSEEEEQDFVQNDEIVQFYKKNTNGTRILCPDQCYLMQEVPEQIGIKINPEETLYDSVATNNYRIKGSKLMKHVKQEEESSSNMEKSFSTNGNLTKTNRQVAQGELQKIHKSLNFTKSAMVANNIINQSNKELTLIQKLEILEQFFGISSIKF